MKFSAFIRFIAILIFGVTTLEASIDLEINKTVWKMYYRVWDNQINQPSWLLEDSDGDGTSNAAELQAGTNPFDTKSVFRISAFSANATGTQYTITFDTIPNKAYIVQTSASLSSNATWTNASPTLKGTGAPITTTVPQVTPAFFRILAKDLDTDGDGVSDWAEAILSYDYNTANTDGSRTDDLTAIRNALASENIVTVSATDPLAVQPNATTQAIDGASFTISRSGGLLFNSILIPLRKSGTAIAGKDYAALPSNVTMAPGVGSIKVDLKPLANPTRSNSVVATVNVEICGGYTIGSPNSASATILPAETTTGVGLTGYYYTVEPYDRILNPNPETVITNYNADTLFQPIYLKTKRLDATIDFNWSGKSPAPYVDSRIFTVRWKGQVQPEFSERYYFNTYTDDGVKLWINGQLIIDKWKNQRATNQYGSIDLKAGVRYDLKMEYYQAKDAYAEAHLYWYSLNQVKQIIPAHRLYPEDAPSAPPAFINKPIIEAIAGQPITFNLEINNQYANPVTFAVANGGALPTGLTLNPNTGLLTGSPSESGEFSVPVSATTSAGTSSIVLNIKVRPAGNGGIRRETWPTRGSTIRDIPLSTAPQSTSVYYGRLEDYSPQTTNTGVRLSGYITAPTTGNYYFWISGTNQAEFWLSDDEEPANKVRRAWVNNAANPTDAKTLAQTWNISGQANQRSPWLALKGGQKYYYEVIHNCGASNADSVAIGFTPDPTGLSPALENMKGVVPAHLLTPYEPNGITAPSPGTLYSTNLSPQQGATTKALGSSSLRLNAAKTQALVYVKYEGLSTGFTGAHIHTEPFEGRPSIILFDIDDIDRFHPELKTADGGYIWDIAAVGQYSREDIIRIIESGYAYVNIHSAKYLSGEIRGNYSRVNGSQIPPQLVPDLGYTPDHTSDYGAARFLNQAAFGASPADLNRVKQIGFSAWINEQIALPSSSLYKYVLNNKQANTAIGQQQSLKEKAWWDISVNAPDQLRQRVAFALSEILVLGKGAASPNGTTNYYDILVRNAFGNYRDLLKEITLNASMGDYLNMRGNAKADFSIARRANENFAREIMQLFSIGLNRLWPDGSHVLDSRGNLIPTYYQPTVNGFSQVFTGWNYYQPVSTNGRLPTNFNVGQDLIQPMTLVPIMHDLNEKVLLNNVVLPAAANTDPTTTATYANPDSSYNGMNAYDVTGLLEFEQALDNIFYHPNVGPYICRQLIQRLVTSHPSPAYVHRVVEKFNDDGSANHVRGNLAAVIKAILLDGEARNSTAANASDRFGKLREPLLRMTTLLRTFLSQPLNGSYNQNTSDLMTITTSSPHLMNAGEQVALDFMPEAELNPPSSPRGVPYSANYGIVSSNSPNQFTVRPKNIEIASYTQSANSNVMKINANSRGSKVNFTMKYYLDFTDSGAPADGIYQLTYNAATKIFTATTADKPSTDRSGNIVIPFFDPANHSITGVGTAGGPIVKTGVSGNHDLKVGDHIWLIYSAVSMIAAGEYKVVSIENNQVFTSTPLPGYENGLRNGGVPYPGVIYPLIPPNSSRAGSVTLRRGNYSLGDTDKYLIQTPLDSTTVFNYFYPEYKHPGNLAANNLTTPEFQIIDETTILALTNTFTNTVVGSGNAINRNGLCSFKTDTGNVYINISGYFPPNYDVSTAAGIGTLIDKFSAVLGVKLSPATRTIITNFVSSPTNFPATVNPVDKVRETLHLIVTSPEYSVQR